MFMSTKYLTTKECEGVF